MLPTKFFDPPSGGSSNNASRLPQQQQQQQCALPPLGMTGVMCKIGSLDIPQRGTIQYRIFRPRQLLSPEKPPLVVLHGGPLIPCNYLLPLAYVIVDRSIIFYDQLGCGQSTKLVGPASSILTTQEETTTTMDRNKKTTAVTTILDVNAMVNDLDCLIQHWNLKQFHLLGHSFGGILMFEYLKYCDTHGNKTKIDRGTCRSAILASVPTSTQLVEEEVQKMCQAMIAAGMDDDGDDDGDDGGDGDEVIPVGVTKKVPKCFRETHECRMVPTPFPLMDSYSRAGPIKLRGLHSIGAYTATLSLSSTFPREDEATVAAAAPPPAPLQPTAPATASTKLQMPVLVLRGQHDFVTGVCVKDWDQLFQDCRYMTLAGCAHYGMLENEVMFGSVLSSFLGDCDEKQS